MGKAVIFVVVKEKEVFKRKVYVCGGGFRVEEGREVRDASFLNGGVFASLILGPI